MNRKLLLLLICVCSMIAPQMVSAQRYSADSTWVFNGNIGLSFNQASFTNWASGGENTVGLEAQFNYSADYKAGKQLWNNRIELAYGFNNTESTGNRKTNDKIYLSSVYGYEVAKNLYLSSLLTFQSQFYDGYSYGSDGEKSLVSTFMAPAYLTVGAGLTWTPKSWFTATFTPVTWREVFVLNDELSEAGSYGVDPGDRSFAECGANLQMTVDHAIMKNVNLYTRLILFSDYLENPQNVDVNWEVQINMTINKWLSTYLTTNLVYDDNINILKSDGSYSPALQFKESFGVGLQVAF